MKSIFLTLTLLILSCGQQVGDYLIYPNPYLIIPKKDLNYFLLGYLKDFVKDAKAHGKDISFDKLMNLKYNIFHGTTVGQCQRYFNQNTGETTHLLIYIDPFYDSVREKAIVYHEFGHCLLGYDHSPQEGGGLMTPIIHSKEYYEENWDRLLKEFFEEGK